MSLAEWLKDAQLAGIQGRPADAFAKVISDAAAASVEAAQDALDQTNGAVVTTTENANTAQAAVAPAEAARDAAQTFANAAGQQAVLAAAQAGLASAASGVATAYARLYPTLAAGLAASVDGQNFSAPSVDGKSVIAYQRQAGAGVQIASMTQQAYLDAMIQSFASGDNFINGNPVLGSLVDSLGRALWYITQDGTFLAKLGLSGSNGVNVTPNADGTYTLSLGKLTTPLTLNSSSIDGNGSAQDLLWAIVDSAEKLLCSITNDGTFLAKLGLSGGSGVNVNRNADGTYSFSLGTVSTPLAVTAPLSLSAPLSLNASSVDGNGSYQDYLYAVVDSLDKMLCAIGNDGTLFAKLPLVQGNGIQIARNPDGTYSIGLAPGSGPATQSIGSVTLDSTAVSTDYLFEISDANDRLLFAVGYDGTLYGKLATPQELVDARGTKNSVDQRLSQSLKPYGLPVHYHWGEWFLRETRMRLRKRSYGDTGVQHIIAAIGDSYSQNPARWTGVMQQILAPVYGDAGPGWCGFGNLGGNLPNGNANSGNASYTKTGSWDISVYFGQYSPDLGQVTSSAAGDLIDVTSVANVSLVRLFYLGTGGVISYRWKDLTLGTWSGLTTLNLASDGLLNTADLVGQPTNPFRLEFAVVSGTVTLFGVDIQKTTDGIRFHKLGASGSSTINWNNANTTQWLAGLVKLAPNLITIMFGTNDQAAMAPSGFLANLTTLVTNIQSVLPYTDIMMICPPENLLGRATPMPQYADAMYQVAQAKNCAFLDLQYVFGPANNPQSYGSTSGRPWFNSDNTHPDPPTGGRAMVDAIYRTLINL